MSDPRSLEIRPTASIPVDGSLLRALRAVPGVRFVIPTTRLLGASVTISKEQGSTDIDLIPSAGGDPLLKQAGVDAPSATEIVLSSRSAEAIGALPGDTIRLEAKRSAHGQIERGSVVRHVKAVLTDADTGLKTGFVSLSNVEAVEDFKEGRSVPAYGWSGTLAVAAPVFDGLMVLSRGRIPEVGLYRLAARSGFRHVRRLPAAPADANGFLELSNYEGRFILEDPPLTRDPDALESTLDEVRGTSIQLLPWNSPINCVIRRDGKSHEKGRLICSPMTASIGSHSGSPKDSVPELFVHSTISSGDATLCAPDGIGGFGVPVKLVPNDQVPEPDVFLADANLTGIIRLSTVRPLSWDSSGGKVLLGRQSYSGFRMYAQSLESVQNVQASLKRMDIESRSEVAQIQRLSKLEDQLTTLFIIVSVFSVGGTGCALALSMFGAIERRKGDYAMLRILGMSPKVMLWLPVLESVFVSGAAYFVALCAFYMLSGLITQIMGGSAATSTSYCYLPGKIQFAALVLTLAVAAVASVLSAFRLTLMSPSDVIHSS